MIDKNEWKIYWIEIIKFYRWMQDWYRLKNNQYEYNKEKNAQI